MKNMKNHSGTHGTGHPSSQSDFYTAAPTERPLSSDRDDNEPSGSRKTLRHQTASLRRPERADPRERAAMIAVIKAAITLVFLCILFFMLWKGIKLYEESVWMENQPMPERSPVMNEVTLVDEFDISDVNEQQSFSARIENWTEAERLLGSVGELLVRNNIDDAIKRCQQVLQRTPAHVGALNYLGELYYEKGMYVEAVNTYIRLLSVEPSNTDYQLALLKALDAYGDAESTIAVAHWYQSRNVYNENVQRYLAKGFFIQENYMEAAEAYERALKDSPRDASALENLSVSYMRLEQYGKALTVLQKLVSIEFRDPICHKRLALCYAQLERGAETAQILGKSAHLFGADTVAMWIQDPMMDPVRMDRDFQLFADSVMTEEYRRYLEEMARAMEKQQEPVIEASLLDAYEKQEVDADLLKPQKK